MKKLVGLLVFAAALAGAILLTQYYKQRYGPPPTPPAPTASPAAPAAPPVTGSRSTTLPPPAASYTDPRAGSATPVTFKTQLVSLDTSAGKGRVSLTLERDPARAAPASAWVWAYFFTPDAPGRYCAGDPVELRQPFAAGNRAEARVEMNVANCPAPHNASSTYYARVNVSTESAFAARLTESRISYDLTQAWPVQLESGRGRPK